MKTDTARKLTHELMRSQGGPLDPEDSVTPALGVIPEPDDWARDGDEDSNRLLILVEDRLFVVGIEEGSTRIEARPIKVGAVKVAFTAGSARHQPGRAGLNAITTESGRSISAARSQST